MADGQNKQQHVRPQSVPEHIGSRTYSTFGIKGCGVIFAATLGRDLRHDRFAAVANRGVTCLLASRRRALSALMFALAIRGCGIKLMTPP
jgi:hypothetical protein